jgi:hypothetical protein
MKRLLVLLLTIFALSSCEQDTTIIDSTAEKQMDKVDVCHYDAETDTWETLSINGNALKAHLAHGDIEGRCEDRKTYIPDDGFEWYLVYYGYDDVMDDYVLTANIENIESMYWDDACCTNPWAEWPYGESPGQTVRVKNMIGIEDFSSLKFLVIYNHPVQEYNIELDRLPALEVFGLIHGVTRIDLDFSNNPNLKEFYLYESGVDGFVDLSNNPLLSKIGFELSSLRGLNLKNGVNENIISFHAEDIGGNPCIQVDDIDYSNDNWYLTGGYFLEDCGY